MYLTPRHKWPYKCAFSDGMETMTLASCGGSENAAGSDGALEATRAEGTLGYQWLLFCPRHAFPFNGYRPA